MAKKKKKKAEKKPKERKVALYLDYEEYRSGGDICEGEEDSQFPCRNDEHITFFPKALYRERKAVSSYLCETLDVPEVVHKTEVAFLVIVRYQTGDSFGTTYGAWSIDGIYSTLVEAAEVTREIQRDRLSHGNLSGGYTCWNGYFERFESVSVQPVCIY